ncbi:MAG TPA: hypothetical protein PLU39_00075 [Armatimonadota bacterium]|nr:hypothetical protein [Armatimonadota bacterium]
MWVVLGLAGAGASALALTTPQDETRFVSVRPPAKRSVSKASQATAAPSGGKALLAPSASGSETTKAASSNGGGPEASGKSQAATAVKSGAAEERNLFRPLVVAKSGRASDSLSLPPAGLDGLLPLPAGNPAEGGRQQRSYWQYVGTVRLDGVSYALVEEQKSKEGHYLKRGDLFRGGRVEVLNPDYLVISVDGKRHTLYKSSGMEETSTKGSAAVRQASASSAPVAQGQQTAAPEAHSQQAAHPTSQGAQPGAPGGPPASAPGAPAPQGGVPTPAVTPLPSNAATQGGASQIPANDGRAVIRDFYQRWRLGEQGRQLPSGIADERQTQ